MNKPNNDPVVERRKLMARAQAQLVEIEQYFRDINYWNKHVRKPDENKIDADPEGEVTTVLDSLAELLRIESTHKIPHGEWWAQIKKIAVEQYGYSPDVAGTMDWESYYLDCTPEEVLKEECRAAD